MDISGFLLSKTRQNVSLIHIEYRFMCIVICIISLKTNDTEPYCSLQHHTMHEASNRQLGTGTTKDASAGYNTIQHG